MNASYEHDTGPIVSNEISFANRQGVLLQVLGNKSDKIIHTIGNISSITFLDKRCSETHKENANVLKLKVWDSR